MASVYACDNDYMTKKAYLSKSDFLKYLVCPQYLWLYKFKREVVPPDDDFVAKQRMKQGNEVEEWARKLYPDGKMVDEKFDEARTQTEKLVADGAKTIFQATVFTDSGLLVKADVFNFDEKSKSWEIREVKSSTKIKKDRFHIEDVAFQKAAFESAGYKIGKTYLVHLDKTYSRHGELSPRGLFEEEDVSEQVDKISPQIKTMADDALKMLKGTEEPKTCSCRLKSKTKHCPTFSYLNPDIPEYSVFNIARIAGKNLALLVDSEVYNVDEVSEDIKLSPIQRNQVNAAKTKQPIIDGGEIAKVLDELEFPLYFLDYETLNLALPIYQGHKPYQHVPFQYSLHVLPDHNAELEHYEFLDRVGKQPPEPELLENLTKQIGKTGNVIVWNKSFEIGRNKDMAETYSQYANFLNDLNDRVFDLMEVFSKQLFIHPGFMGSSSIKKVLPVMVPEFSYKEMDIQSGDVAAIRWYDATSGNVSKSQAEKTFDSLIKYCGLDTLAMVKIYEALKAV